MGNNDNSDNFYNLEKNLFKSTERQRANDLKERKKPFKNRPSSSLKVKIISRKKFTMLFFLGILAYYILPIAQAYFIKAQISNAIQESDEIQKNIIDSLMFKIPVATNYSDKYIHINNTSYKITINIGQTGKKIVNGTGHINLTPIITGDSVKWLCKAHGTGLQENYLPNNCKLLK